MVLRVGPTLILRRQGENDTGFRHSTRTIIFQILDIPTQNVINYTPWYFFMTTIPLNTVFFVHSTTLLPHR